MSRYNDKDIVQRLVRHMGHRVEIVGYGMNAKPPWENIAIECDSCATVLLDWNVHKTKKGYVPDEECDYCGSTSCKNNCDESQAGGFKDKRRK
jgi:hypothetical protein